MRHSLLLAVLCIVTASTAAAHPPSEVVSDSIAADFTAELRFEFTSADAMADWISLTGTVLRCDTEAPNIAYTSTDLGTMERLGFAVKSGCSVVSASSMGIRVANRGNIDRPGPEIGDEVCDARLVWSGANGNLPPLAVPARHKGLLVAAAEQIDPKFDAYDESQVGACGLSLPVERAIPALNRCVGDSLNDALRCLDEGGELATVHRGNRALWHLEGILQSDPAKAAAYAKSTDRPSLPSPPNGALDRFGEHLKSYEVDHTDLKMLAKLMGREVPPDIRGQVELVLAVRGLFVAIGGAQGGG